MSAASLGLGVVGTGIMGRRFLTALQAGARWHAAALWDPRAESLRAAAALAPQARIATRLDELVNDEAVRLVYVASPPSFHREGVEAALRAGRAVLCEKPLASSVAEARALRDAVVASGLPFAVNFPFATSTPARRLAAIVRDGELGTLQRARIRLRFAQWPRPWQAGASEWLAGPGEGGFTREVLSHFVFLALRLFGPASVADVRLQRHPGQAEHALQVRLVHDTGPAVEIDAAVAGDIADDNRFEVVGSGGTAVLSGWSRLEHGGQVTERADGLALLLQALAAQAGGGAAEGTATVDEALAVVRVIEALLAG